MDLTLTNEQEQMRETLRDFLQTKDGTYLARRVIDGDYQVVDELWDDLAQMDYMALTVPFEHMGLGEDMPYLTLVLEEAGRVAMPGPYPETMAFAAPLIAEVGTEAQKETLLTEVANGDRKLSFALYDTGEESLPVDIRLEPSETDQGFVLNGTKTMVPYAGMVDTLVVATRIDSGEDGVTLFLVDVHAPGVETRRLESLDQTRPMYEVRFDEVTLSDDDQLGPVNGGGPLLSRAIDRFTVATCAMLVGGAERAVELSVEHGNTREQFGQPIGRFQGVKHRIADMWMEMRAGRSLVYYAAWALANDKPDARRAVSAAAAHCGEKCVRIFDDDIQTHGGTGFTWDHDGHIYLKQVKAWQSFLGSPQEHRERICEARDI